jgi:hypothetical protein
LWLLRVFWSSAWATGPCLVFISSNAAFDLHWVDADGKEIPVEAALKNAKAPAHKKKP